MTETDGRFKIRGFIEGFYGNPWSREGRERVLLLMAKHGMNTYFYAPKDDPFHRDRWREKYPDEKSRELGDLASLCRENGIALNYCIAPGLSIRFTDENDYSALIAKLLSVAKLGVRGFGLLMDDIPPELYHPEDIQKYGRAVYAHASLANRLYDDLCKALGEIDFTVCPMQYHGKGDEEYITALGRRLHPDIRIFWTGRKICSDEITSEQAAYFERNTRHRPLYWDNYPVNDAEMYHEMHLGALEGRDKDLWKYSDGMIFNCMEYSAASQIPLITCADYLMNPESYNPAESLKNAITEVMGDEAEKFTYFADNLQYSCLGSENSPVFNSVSARWEQETGAGNKEKATEIMEEYYAKLLDCCELLNSEGEIFAELSRWAEKQKAACALLGNTLDYVKNPTEEKYMAVKKEYAAYRRIPEVLYDFSFVYTIERMLEL